MERKLPEINRYAMPRVERYDDIIALNSATGLNLLNKLSINESKLHRKINKYWRI